MTVVDCPYCHETEQAGERLPSDPPTVRCRGCGLYRPYPRMDCETQQAFFTALYEMVGEEKVHAPVRPVNRRLRWEIRLLRAGLGGLQGRRALDVGCGTGGFVVALQEAGADTVGLEPVEAYAEAARRHGLEVLTGRFEEGGLPAALSGKPFDLMCFRESLYYMRDLRETFDLVQMLLVPGGGLYIKSHVVTNVFYRRHRDVLARYRPAVAGLPTEDFLLSALGREGYGVRAVAYPAFDLVAMLRWKISIPLIRGGIGRLNNLLVPRLCRASRRLRSVADCVAIVAATAWVAPGTGLTMSKRR